MVQTDTADGATENNLRTNSWIPFEVIDADVGIR
jgi:hypothetical protein